MTKSGETDILRFLNEDCISCGLVRITNGGVDLVITDLPVESKRTYCAIIKLMTIELNKCKFSIERIRKQMRIY